ALRRVLTSRSSGCRSPPTPGPIPAPTSPAAVPTDGCAAVERTPRAIPAPTSPAAAPTDGCAAVERTIPAPTSPAAAPTDDCAAGERTIPAPTAPATAPTGSVGGRAMATTVESVGAKVAVIDPAIAKIGTDGEGATDRAAMNASNREGRERSADDGMRL